MLESPFSALVRQLGAYATATGGPLPLLDGRSAPLKQQPVAFLARGCLRAPEGIWFRQTPTFRALGSAQVAAAPRTRHFLVVHWRWLLAQGLLSHDLTADVTPALRRLAHQAWRALVPLIEEHDVVLARLLTDAARNMRDDQERLECDPFWVGFNTPADYARFDAHATALLASRRTDKQPHDGFCELATQLFARVFKGATHTREQQTVGLCIVGRHTRGAVCPTCPEIAQERRFLSVLEVPSLVDRTFRHGVARSNHPTLKTTTDPLLLGLRWIADARSRHDGVYRFTAHNGLPARFIDIQRLWRRWRELNMVTMFDDLGSPDVIEGPRQAAAFLTKQCGSAILSARDYAAEQLFIDAAWGTAEDYQTSYSSFVAVSEQGLLYVVRSLDARFASLAKARLAAARAHVKPLKPARRVVTRTWRPADGGPAVDIKVIRAASQGKRVHNFYTTPFIVDASECGARARTGRGLHYDEAFYWTPHAINGFANKHYDDGEPHYPQAREFCDWVLAQEPELNTSTLFSKAVYSERLPERLDAIARGDQAHLGSFSLQEDQRIIAFFVDAPPKRRLTAADWASLLEKLPGRTERGVLKRFEDLGKKYAFAHGYQAYAQSPYCRKFAAKRRMSWLKEGCPA